VPLVRSVLSMILVRNSIAIGRLGRGGPCAGFDVPGSHNTM
jgi:hypothetical protein